MVEQDRGISSSSDEFEINGEVYRLELRNGRRVPVKTLEKAPVGKTFKRKCWQCDGPGHFGRDCTYTPKADGKPLNPNKNVPANLLDKLDAITDMGSNCGIIDTYTYICNLDII